MLFSEFSDACDYAKQRYELCERNRNVRLKKDLVKACGVILDFIWKMQIWLVGAGKQAKDKKIRE